MKDVIIDTGRYGGGWSRKGRQKDLEELPEKEGMKGKYGWNTKSFGDRTQPLDGFLRKNVGRPWDKVWSEICQHNDSRSIRGYHLREHIWDYVQTWGEYNEQYNWRYRSGWGYHIDQNGILRKNKNRREKWKPKMDPDACCIGDTEYKRVNGCWFEVWYERVEYNEKQYSYLTRRVETVRYYDWVQTRQRQLGKKELKYLGLSNEPGWLWYSDHRAFSRSERADSKKNRV